MENASKALIIAGSVLIAMIVLSILVWGWNRVSNYYKSEENAETVQQLYVKNKELESYNKQIVRGYELRSLYNLITDMNTRFEKESGYTEITATIKLLENNEIVQYFKNIDNLSTNSIRYLWNSKSDFKDFMDKYYLKVGREKDFLKIFNESYFKCDKILYNGELEGQDGKGTARVQSFEFSELKRK